MRAKPRSRLLGPFLCKRGVLLRSAHAQTPRTREHSAALSLLRVKAQRSPIQARCPVEMSADSRARVFGVPPAFMNNSLDFGT